MGGFFGAACNHDAIEDVFFGTDYHSHLGTRRGGMAAYDPIKGLQRDIHNIENSPFRTKFSGIFDEMTGTSAIGCISDSDPQPLLIRSALGKFAICTIGLIRNAEELIDRYFTASSGHFNAMTGGAVNATDLAAALISRKSSFAEGIKFVQDLIVGSLSMLILCEDGSIIAARDKLGRTPVLVGKNEGGYCVSFESFAYQKLDYMDEHELGPGEIVRITKDSMEILQEPGKKMCICSFLWTYYGYSSSNYEGVNVEAMRYRDGGILAENDKKTGNLPDIDYVSGFPDSGTPHAIGYANQSGISFARPYIKYTPTWSRSFTPAKQVDRNRVAKMKQIPIKELIKDKKLLFVDDSIVRGTQLKETVEFLYENGAKEVHMRIACPPIMYSCKYLNFTRSNSEMDLITRRVIMELEGKDGFEHLEEYSDSSTERGRRLREALCHRFRFDSLEFQTLDGIIDAIGIDKENLCTYCWTGKE